MGVNLRDALLKSGAVIDGASRLPLHFGAPRAELHAALHVCAVADRSTYAHLIGDGPDLADLLNRLSTNAVADLQPGHGVETVLTSAKGRIVERLFVEHLGAPGLLLIGGADRSGEILTHLGKYTFAETTGLRDAADDYRLLMLTGPAAADALGIADLAVPDPLGVREGTHDGRPLYILGHDGDSAAGFSVLVAAAQAGSLWQALVLAVSKSDGRPAGELALAAARIRHGIPRSGSELTDDHNPLEAGLRDAVSFDKGCYVGQEVVARLNTYDKVSRRIVGLELPDDVAPAAAQTRLYRDEREAGTITSVAAIEGSPTVALAYVKKRVADIGDTVQVGAPDGTPVTLCDFPMLS